MKITQQNGKAGLVVNKVTKTFMGNKFFLRALTFSDKSRQNIRLRAITFASLLTAFLY